MADSAMTAGCTAGLWRASSIHGALQPSSGGCTATGSHSAMWTPLEEHAGVVTWARSLTDFPRRAALHTTASFFHDETVACGEVWLFQHVANIPTWFFAVIYVKCFIFFSLTLLNNSTVSHQSAGSLAPDYLASLDLGWMPRGSLKNHETADSETSLKSDSYCTTTWHST